MEALRARHTRGCGIVLAAAVAAGLSPAGPSRAAAPPTPVVEAASLDDFQLPPKTVFDRAMPRYPNVWLHVSPSVRNRERDSSAGCVRRSRRDLGIHRARQRRCPQTTRAAIAEAGLPGV